MVWPPDARNRNHFSTEKGNMLGLFLEFFWQHEFLRSMNELLHNNIE